MRENYRGNKKRREEAQRKKQEEKRNKRLNKSNVGQAPAAETQTPPPVNPPAVQI